MITVSYPDLALLEGLNPAAGEVKAESMSVCTNACFLQRNISVILTLFFLSKDSLFIFKDH